MEITNLLAPNAKNRVALKNLGEDPIFIVFSDNPTSTRGIELEKAFKEAKVNLVTLTNYEAVLEAALKTGYINEEDVPVLDAWRKDPAHWDAGK